MFLADDMVGKKDSKKLDYFPFDSFSLSFVCLFVTCFFSAVLVLNRWASERASVRAMYLYLVKRAAAAAAACTDQDDASRKKKHSAHSFFFWRHKDWYTGNEMIKIVSRYRNDEAYSRSQALCIAVELSVSTLLDSMLHHKHDKSTRTHHSPSLMSHHSHIAWWKSFSMVCVALHWILIRNKRVRIYRVRLSLRFLLTICCNDTQFHMQHLQHDFVHTRILHTDIALARFGHYFARLATPACISLFHSVPSPSGEEHLNSDENITYCSNCCRLFG